MAFGQYMQYVGMAVGAIVGVVITIYTGGTGFGSIFYGAALGASIGGAVGGISGQIFWPEKADINAPPPPQPHETRLQFSSWGMPIPIQYGSGRMSGNIIYMSDIVETIERSKHRQDGVRYYEMVRTYTATFAIAFCEGPVKGIARIWLNNKIFVDYRDPSSPYYPEGDDNLSIGNLSTSIARAWTFYSVHLGAEDQSADPSIEALITAAETPAYRGHCYIVFKDFPIGEFSGVPQIEIEIDEVSRTLEVNNGPDDGYYHIGADIYNINGVQLQTGGSTSFGTTIGLQFSNSFPFPEGFSVNSAKIKWTSNGWSGFPGQTVSIRYYCALVLDASMPYDRASFLALPLTTSYVNQGGIVDSRAIDEVFYSPELATLVNEVMTQPGWVAYNNILFVIKGVGSSSANYWFFWSFDGSADKSPKLELEF